MMMQVIQSGTGKRAQLDRDAAGKTGTTDAQKDAWFVGFTADYVVGVWMGNDDNTPLNDVTGGGIPAEIWREVMVRINEGVPARPLEYIVPEPRLPPGSTAAAVPQPAERELTAAERAEAKRARQDRRERREERRRRDPLGDALREIFRNP